MARKSISCICSVLQVKPFSGYYRSCPTCERKLGTVEFNSIPLPQRTRYWCRSCCVDWSVKELGLRYCLILTVTDYPSGTKVISLFGRALEPIFGLPAAQMHKYLDRLEGGEMPKHDLLLNSLRMLLIGACVELTFARGSDIRHDTGTGTGNGQTVKMSGQIANGMKILGGNNETVLSLLSAQEERSHKPAFVDLERSEERDTGSLAAANHSSMTTQHNSRCVVHHNSYSFLYDTKSQKVDAATQGPTNHPLQLESFLETQSRSQSINDSGPLGVHVEDPDVEASQQIIRELESEWESSQQTQKQLPGDLDFDLALSEEVVSELQQTFDLSGDLASTPEPGATLAKRRSLAKARDADTTLIGLNTVTPLSNFVSKSCASTVNRTVQCQGTPELFSSCKPTHKKLTHLGGGAREQSQSSPYFSPELFGPTPLVCRLSGPPANTGATPSSLRSKMHTPKRSLLHDSSLIMTTPLCHAAAVPQDLMSRPLNTSGVSNNYSCISTPHTQSKESNTILSTASSPDLFS